LSAKINLNFVVNIGYIIGDYAQLCGNGGEGEIDWVEPLTVEKFDLFPAGQGIFGLFKSPCFTTKCYSLYSTGPEGCYSLPCYKGPVYLGSALIESSVIVDNCGDYKFGFAVYDEAGNDHEGSPDEAILYIHIAPPAPTGLKKYSYDKETDVLILTAA
jgi:hypothetical protein